MGQTGILTNESPASWERWPKREREALLRKAEEELSRLLGGKPLPEADLSWREWLGYRFPAVCTHPFALRHERLWEWFDALEPGRKPRPRVEVWPRGGAKSSSGELGCVRVGIKLSRRFALYVCGTQDQADEHVKTVGSLFEQIGVERALNRYGSSKGWRRDQLRTANGFNVAAFGLDTAARGIKVESYRPDLLIFDDVDARTDTPERVGKKATAITQSLLPTGSTDCAVLVLQNIIHKDSIVAQLVDGRADFLHDREVPSVEPAVVDMEVEQVAQEDGTLRYRITRGTPTWAGQDLAVCEAQINEWGYRAFLREVQHQVDEEEGGLWTREHIAATRVTRHPELIRVAVAVDPNATTGGDEAGIIGFGVGKVEGVLHGYVLEDATESGGPKAWAEAAVTLYHKLGADVLVAESNNGGEMVEITIRTVEGAPPVKLLHASRGKITRAEPVQKLYEDGRIHHVGHFALLETELCTYKPGMPSPNRMDALVWAATETMLAEKRVLKVFG